MDITGNPVVHIVDDDPAVRDSLRELLDSVGLRNALYASAEEFLENCAPASEGCLLIDIRLTGMTGLDLQRLLPDRGVDLPIIILTGHGDVPAARQAFKEGAVDFLSKPFNPPELIGCLRAAIAHDRRAREQRAAQREAAARRERLSAREREVLDLVVAGLANKQIAVRLGIAERTVEDHRSRVMQVMSVDSMAQLVRLATLCER